MWEVKADKLLFYFIFLLLYFIFYFFAGQQSAIGLHFCFFTFLFIVRCWQRCLSVCVFMSVFQPVASMKRGMQLGSSHVDVDRRLV